MPKEISHSIQIYVFDLPTAIGCDLYYLQTQFYSSLFILTYELKVYKHVKSQKEHSSFTLVVMYVHMRRPPTDMFRSCQ